MSFDAGTILATADINGDPFHAGLERLKAEAREFAAGNYNASVGVASSGSAIDQERAKLDQFGTKTATATLRVDAGEADAGIDKADAKADEFGRKRETATLSVDSSGADKGIKDIESAAASAAGPGGMGALLTAALSLGPALIPISGVAVAGIGALLPVLASAGAGFAAFGLAAAGDLGKVKSVAELTLADFQRLASPAVLPVINNSLGFFIPLFSALMPLVDSTSGELLKLEASGKAAFSAPFWQGFITFLSAQAGPAINSVMSLLGGTFKFLAGTMQAFGPIISDVEGGIQGFSARIASYGQNLSTNSGFQSFLSYIRTEAPVVGQLLVNLGGDVEKIIIALAPIGAVVLQGVTSLTGFLHVLLDLGGPLNTVVIAAGLLYLAYSKIAPVVRTAEAAILAFTVTTQGVEGVAGGSESALAGLIASMGGLGVALPFVGGGLLAAGLAFWAFKSSADAANSAADHMLGSLLTESATTLSGLGKQLDDLTAKWRPLNNLEILFSSLGTDLTATQRDELAKLGTRIEQTKEAIATYKANLSEVADQTGLTKAQTESLAQSLNIDLTKALSPSQIRQFNSALQEQSAQAGLSADALRRMASSSSVSMSQMASNIGATTTAVRSSWASLGNAVTAFASSTLPPTAEAITNFYSQSELQGAAFTQNISKAIQMGYSPLLVSQIITAGPGQAAQLLAGMVSAQGAGLVALINQATAAMAKEGAIAVEEARLTQHAVNASTSTIAAQLPQALALSQQLTMTNAAAAVQAVATQYNLTLPQVIAIAGNYGVALPKNILAQVTGAQQAAAAQVAGVNSALGQGLPAISNTSGLIGQILPNSVNAAVPQTVAAATNHALAFANTIHSYDPFFVTTGTQVAASTIGAIAAANFTSTGALQMDNLIVGFSQGGSYSTAHGAGGSAADAALATMSATIPVFVSVGGQMAAALASGLGFGAQQIAGAASAAVFNALSAAQATASSHPVVLPAPVQAPGAGFFGRSSLGAVQTTTNNGPTVSISHSIPITIQGHADATTVAQVGQIVESKLDAHDEALMTLLDAR